MQTPIIIRKYQVKRLKNSTTDLSEAKGRSRCKSRTDAVFNKIKEFTKR